MPLRLLHSTLLTLSVAVAASASVAASTAGAASERQVGHAPSPPPGAQDVGALASQTTLHLRVILAPRDPQGLADFATAVSTPGSPLYRHYLRRGEFAARFGASPATIAAVESALRAAGLNPGPAAPNALSIPVDSSASTVSHALHVGFQRYRLRSGRVAFANTAAPSLPGGVAGAVRTVVGLNNLTVHRPLIQRPSTRSPRAVPQPQTSGPQACTAASNAASSWGAYLPANFATAYGMSSLYGAGDLGQGVTVALYELEPNSTTDIAAYQTCFGTSTSVGYATVDGGAGSGAGEGEAALDIEDVIGLAPQATLKVYQGPNNTNGPYDTYNQIVQDDTAQVISTSWGLCEAYSDGSELTAENTLFQQAAVQGQTIAAAAGDSGSEDCGDGTLAVDDPASQPYVTGVGGTTMTNVTPTERVWNNAGNGTGGGVSSKWRMPPWQTTSGAVGVLSSHTTGTTCGAPAGSYCRQVPDVSADADPNTGYTIYWSGSWGSIGGTSAAAPLWASLTALANASSGCSGKGPLGFLNPKLYTIAARAAHGSAFHDVTSGNNDVGSVNGGLFPAGTGYDMATGLGTPIGSGTSGLVNQLCGFSNATPTVTAVGPTTGPESGGQTVTITGSGFSGATAVHFGAAAATSYRVVGDSQISALAPAGSGTADVTVSAAGGTSSIGAADRYTYVATPATSTPAPPPTPTPTPTPTTNSSGTPTPVIQGPIAPPTPPQRSVSVSFSGALRGVLGGSVDATSVRLSRDGHGRIARVAARVTLRDAKGGTATVVYSFARGRHGWSGSVIVSDRRLGLKSRFRLAGKLHFSGAGAISGVARGRVRRGSATIHFALAAPSATAASLRAALAAVL